MRFLYSRLIFNPLVDLSFYWVCAGKYIFLQIHIFAAFSIFANRYHLSSWSHYLSWNTGTIKSKSEKMKIKFVKKCWKWNHPVLWLCDHFRAFSYQSNLKGGFRFWLTYCSGPRIISFFLSLFVSPL